MAYTTVIEWLVMYPAIAKTSVNSATMNGYLEKAAAYIDGYIAPVVTLPLTPAPQLIKDLNDDLAYAMFLRRNVYEASKDGSVEAIWKECVNRLENIKNGYVMIVGSGGVVLSTITRNASPYSNVSGYTPTFGVATDIEDAEVDPDREDAETSARQ